MTNIRRATIEDAEAIAPLFDLYCRFYEQPSDPALARRFIGERLQQGESVIFLAEAQAAKAAAAQASIRKLQVGSGDRSQRIRTYNFPQGRITDHRVEGLTLYDLPNVIEGDLQELVDRLQHEHQADELARLTHDA